MADFTQELIMHVRGTGYSFFQYRIHADAKRTDMVRIIKTSGSPHYRKVSDVLVCGCDEFDILSQPHDKLKVWMAVHLPASCTTTQRV